MGELLVQFHVGLFDDDLGTEPKGLVNGAAGFDAVGSGLIRGGCQHAANASVGINELAEVIVSGRLMFKKVGRDKGAAVVKTEKLTALLMRKDLGVPPSANSHRSALQTGVKGTFCRDKKTVEIDVYFHTMSILV